MKKLKKKDLQSVIFILTGAHVVLCKNTCDVRTDSDLTLDTASTLFWRGRGSEELEVVQDKGGGGEVKARGRDRDNEVSSSRNNDSGINEINQRKHSRLDEKLNNIYICHFSSNRKGKDLRMLPLHT